VTERGATSAKVDLHTGDASPAPQWFQDAIAAPHEAGQLDVEGASIEFRAWGERSKPGVLLMHGNSAHLGWWSFLAPLLATDYRVVAFSFSGMGQSGWRDGYSIAQYMREAFAVCAATGADEGGPPVFIGHSLGGYPVLHAAATSPHKLRAAIIVDSALAGSEMTETPSKPSGKTYPDLETAMTRFRFSPRQPCDNDFIVDHMARMALGQLPDGHWTWRFDPALGEGADMGDLWGDLARVQVPLAVVRGAKSDLTAGAMERRIRQTAPPGTCFIEIPEAYHHVMADQPLALVACLRALLAAWA